MYTSALFISGWVISDILNPVEYIESPLATVESKEVYDVIKESLDTDSAVLSPPEHYVEQDTGVTQTVFYNLDSESMGWVIRTNAFPLNTTVTACDKERTLCHNFEIYKRVDNDSEASVPLNIFRKFKKTGGVTELILYPNYEN